MDKYEFNLKIEQMKKLVNEEDYVTALKIADSIDWDRVRNSNLLTLAATVYEKNDRLQDARDMLVRALERAPVGKRLLFKLSELAVRSGDLEEAEDYYHEFRTIAPDDRDNYLLQYMLLKAGHAPYEKQLQPLERYCEIDPDEKWLYELATSYEYAGRIDDCVRTCDRIALLYGTSLYATKALRLKGRYAELSDAQKNILTPRTVTENEARPQNYYAAQDSRSMQEIYGNPPAPEYREVPVAEEEYESYADRNADRYRLSDELAATRYEDEDAMFEAYVRAHAIGNIGLNSYVAPDARETVQEEVPVYEEQEMPQAPVYTMPEYQAPEYQTAVYTEPEAAQAHVYEGPGVSQAPASTAPESSQAYVYTAPEAPQAPAYTAPEAPQAPAYTAPEAPQVQVYAAPEVPQAPDAVTEAAAPAVRQLTEEELLSAEEGQQMAFDFGGGIPQVIEEAEEEAVEAAENAVPVQPVQAAPVQPASTPLQTAAPVSFQPAAAPEQPAAAPVQPAAPVPFQQTAAPVQPAVTPVQPAGTVQAAAPASAIPPVQPMQPAAPAQPASPVHSVPPVQTVPPTPVLQARTTFTAPQVQPAAPAPAYTAQATPAFTAPAAHNTAAAPAAGSAKAAGTVPSESFHMIIEAETLEAGLEIAVEELKAIHEENGIVHASAKTTADKLNQKGLTDAIISKIRGKDFVIEKAGDLDPEVIEDIYRLIRTDRSGMIVVLIDTPEGLDKVEDVRPELFDLCDYISDLDEEEQTAPMAKAAKKEQPADRTASAPRPAVPVQAARKEEKSAAYGDADDDYDEYDDDDDEADAYEDSRSVKEPQKRSNGKVVSERFNNVKELGPKGRDEQLEIDEFAQYCNEYAAQIDCNISGKSMLALYERIELMEEDGIPLTKATAEQLIEEAADRAEKPPLGKRLTGMFHSKYDKNGLLILKEEDFIF